MQEIGAANGRTHIYIVDADRTSRLSLMQRVAEHGWVGRPFLSGADFIEELPHLPCGVVLLDIFNAGPNGFNVIEAVVRMSLACPVIATSEAADAQVAVAALKRGAVDFLEKPIAPDALAEALGAAEQIMAKRRLIFEQTEADRTALERLSEREREVLTAMAAGKTSKVVAQELGIGVRTVEAYRASLIAKLGVAAAAAAVAILVRYDTARHTHAVRIATSLEA